MDHPPGSPSGNRTTDYSHPPLQSSRAQSIPMDPVSLQDGGQVTQEDSQSVRSIDHNYAHQATSRTQYRCLAASIQQAPRPSLQRSAIFNGQQPYQNEHENNPYILDTPRLQTSLQLMRQMGSSDYNNGCLKAPVNETQCPADHTGESLHFSICI
jgi:hypothetical protein